MKVLVTGGAGFIGSHIVEHFQHQADVVAFDNLRTGSKDNLKGLRCQYVFGSILNRLAVRRAMQGVDYLFHLAGMVSVTESMNNPIECAEINTLGTLIVLEEAAIAGVKKVAFSSSASVYGDGPAVPRDEGSQMEPKSPYAATKLAGEVYCQMFSLERNLPTVSLRYFNVFGPRQGGNNRYGAVSIFVRKAVQRLPLKVNGDGKQIRDFIFVKDVAAASAYLALHPKTTGSFNIGTGTGITVNDLAESIVRLAGSNSTIEAKAERIGDIRYSVADVGRLKAAGYLPTTDLERDLKTTITWFSDPKNRP